MFREAGMADQCAHLLSQVEGLANNADSKVCSEGEGCHRANVFPQADDLLLSGRIELKEAFDHFKTDLWMSSLTESSETSYGRTVYAWLNRF
jgi:hypothetical protein